MKVIAVGNQKGGVGKTTTVHHLAVALAQRGLRVLAVDLDPQAHLTVAARVSAAMGSIYDVLDGRKPISEVIVPSCHGIDVLPSEQLVARLEGRESSPTAARELRLALQTLAAVTPYDATLNQNVQGERESRGDQPFSGRSRGPRSAAPGGEPDPGYPMESRRGLPALPEAGSLGDRGGRARISWGAGADFMGRYDVCLLDTPPSLGFLSTSALIAADAGVLVPLVPEALPLKGLQLLLTTVRELRHANPQLHVRGIVPTMVRPRWASHRAVADVLPHLLSDIPLLDPVPCHGAFAQAAARRVPVFSVATTSTAAAAYRALAASVLPSSTAERAAA